MNKHCQVGIEIDSVADKEARPLLIPCCNPGVKHLCARYDPYTPEEIAETEAQIAAFIEALASFGAGKSRTCPTCGVAIEHIMMYGKSEPDTYSLYIQPCNHRIGLWQDAPQWAKDAGIVTIVPF